MTQMLAPAFRSWPKIPRVDKLAVVATEKIDGTNAAVGILADGTVYAQSRKRIITPREDNFGFATWVTQNAKTLWNCLGPGLHFGEWWGRGIQRGYEMVDRRFALFDHARWENCDDYDQRRLLNVGVLPVPRIAVNTELSQRWMDNIVLYLGEFGSRAAPGFMDPEGVVFHLEGTNVRYKRLLGAAADVPKSLVNA